MNKDVHIWVHDGRCWGPATAPNYAHIKLVTGNCGIWKITSGISGSPGSITMYSVDYPGLFMGNWYWYLTSTDTPPVGPLGASCFLYYAGNDKYIMEVRGCCCCCYTAWGTHMAVHLSIKVYFQICILGFVYFTYIGWPFKVKLFWLGMLPKDLVEILCSQCIDLFIYITNFNLHSSPKETQV